MGTDTDEITMTVGKAPDVEMPRRSRKRLEGVKTEIRPVTLH